MSSSQEDLFSRPTQDNAVVTATTGITQEIDACDMEDIEGSLS